MTKVHTGNEALKLLKKIRMNRKKKAGNRVSNWLSQALALKMGEVLEITECCEWEIVPGEGGTATQCNDVQYLRQKLFSPELKGQFTTTHSQKICAVWRLKPAKEEDKFDWTQVPDGGGLTITLTDGETITGHVT